MNKRTIWTIIALMLIGLLGIVAVQVYWLAKASALEQSLFKQRVHRALNNVARQLEIRETKALILQSLNDVRKTAEAVKNRRTGTLAESRLSEEKPHNTLVPDNTPASAKIAKAKPLALDSSSVATHSKTATAPKPQQETTSEKNTDKNTDRNSERNTVFSMSTGGNGFEMRFGDANVMFQAPKDRTNPARPRIHNHGSDRHTNERVSQERHAQDKAAQDRALQERSASAAIIPIPSPQTLIITVPGPDGQPLRFAIPNNKLYSLKRDSVVQRFRRSFSNYGAAAQSVSVYPSVPSSRTLEDRINAAEQRRKERAIENATSGAAVEAAPNADVVIQMNGDGTKDAQKVVRVPREFLNGQVQREFAHSQQMIERLRRLQGDTREFDSLFNLAFKQWNSMGNFGFEMSIMPPPPTGAVMPPEPPPTALDGGNTDASNKKLTARNHAKNSVQSTSSKPQTPEMRAAASQQYEAQSKTESRSRRSDTISTIVDKIDLIENILENMVANNRGALDRVPLADLEQLLATELRENGVNTRYEYGVLRGNGSEERQTGKRRDSMLIVRTSTAHPSEAQTPHISAALKTSEFQVQLFPNDILGSDEKDYLAVRFPDYTTGLTLAGIAPVLGSSVLFLLLIMGCFGFTFVALMRQKKLSDMKTDFINNMTHELKTPIATISIASEALKDDHIRSEGARVERFVNIIHDENKRLAGHVEKVLQAAQMDRGELNLKYVSLDAHTLLRAVADSLALQIEQKHGQIELRLEAHTPVLQADEAHFRNMLMNLLDNANKYTPDVPHIIISTRNTAQGLAITIEDNGIGMSRDAQKQIFEKFYRVPTGNRHDVKGFGLGLNYVKTIIEAHGGKISVKSELGKGSTFEVVMPSQQQGLLG